jgi:hypothetical protein
MKQIQKIALEQALYNRAYQLAKDLDQFEWSSRFEEGRWLLKEFERVLSEQEAAYGDNASD